MTCWNANTLTEKNKILKQKSSDTNDNSENDATDQLITLKNEATQDAAAAAAASASAIAPDLYFLSSGLQLDTKLFLKGNINNRADRDTLNTTLLPDALISGTPDAAAQKSPTRT